MAVDGHTSFIQKLLGDSDSEKEEAANTMTHSQRTAAMEVAAILSNINWILIERTVTGGEFKGEYISSEEFDQGKYIVKVLKNSLKILEVTSPASTHLSRVMFLYARMLHKLEQAVSSEGMFNAGFDIMTKQSSSLSRQQRVDLAEGKLWSHRLLKEWDKRDSDAARAMEMHDSIQSSLASNSDCKVHLSSLFHIGSYGFNDATVYQDLQF